VSDLFNSLHGLDVNEQERPYGEYFENDRVEDLLPNYAKNAKTIESKLKVLESVRLAYTHMTFNRSYENQVYRKCHFVYCCLLCKWSFLELHFKSIKGNKIFIKKGYS